MKTILFLAAILCLLCASFTAVSISAFRDEKSKIRDYGIEEFRSRAQRDIRILEPPCPKQWNISPCDCNGRPGVPNINCSAVTNAAELKRIFSYPDHQHFRSIEIHNSQLETLEADQFGIHTAVLFLLSDNKIKTIDKDAFKASSTMINLMKLDGNELNSFPFEALQQMKSLQVLVLSKNQLKEIPSEAFPQIENLQVIDLNENQLTSVGKNAFSKLKSLQKIILANNDLKTIGERTFTIDQQEVSLQINLANNSIIKIEPSAFAGVRIENLNLDNNQLETMPRAVFEPLLNDGSTLSVEGNPLKCNSPDLKWLLEKPSNVQKQVQGLPC